MPYPLRAVTGAIKHEKKQDDMRGLQAMILVC
jgi:hypothetical protein